MGVERLITQRGVDTEYVMIGDSDSDIIQVSHPVKMHAVGNASENLKDRAQQTGGDNRTASFDKRCDRDSSPSVGSQTLELRRTQGV